MRLGLAAVALGATLAAASGAWAFDARSPEDVLGVLKADGASPKMKKEADGRPYIVALKKGQTFVVRFHRCNDDKTSCQVVVYNLTFAHDPANVDQINRWNVWSLLCPADREPPGHPHVRFSVLAAASDTRDTVVAEQNEWQACLTDFAEFAHDPEGFLKAHE